MATKSTDRRGFLGDVLKLSAGAAALGLVAGCDALDADDGGRRGRKGRRGCKNRHGREQSTTRVAEPTELFEPMTMEMVMEEKWKLDKILSRPDGHLRVRLVDVTTQNALDIELFRGPDPLKRAIATTDLWEFYTYNEAQRGKDTPDHVKDAINQLAALILENEHDPAAVNLNKSVILFNDRQHDEPTPSEKPANTAPTGA